MILVTVTKKQGVLLATPYDLAIDPEKIVSTRVLDGNTQIDYAETFDRNIQTITYEVTAAKPNIDATITGEYTTHVYLSLVVYWSDNKDLIPFPAISTTYALDMQEKYIIDIQDVPFELYWKNSKISTNVRKVRFVPGAFKQEVVYVTNALNDLVDNIPSETTTTSTAAPMTTTTTEIANTTTEPATTTTTWDGVCREYTITNLDEQLPAIFLIENCENRCVAEYIVVEFGQPQTVCLCAEPVYVAGSESYAVVRGGVCLGTTTTTEEPTTTTTSLETTTTTTEILVPSDMRLKKNIKFAGKHVGGHPEFTWEWNDEAIRLGFNKYPTKGVLAQEVMKTNPEAVKMGKDGYYKVNYKKL